MQHNIFNIIFGVMYINSHDLRNYVSLNIRIECSRWFFKIILSIRRKKKKKSILYLIHDAHETISQISRQIIYFQKKEETQFLK